MSLRRVVVTGMGIVSCIGNDLEQVTHSLRTGHSGLRYALDVAEHGCDCHVMGRPEIDIDALIERKRRRFMGGAAAFVFLSMQQAIADAQLQDQHIRNDRTGIIAGSGLGSPTSQQEAVETMQSRGLRRVSPYLVPRWMGSTVSANMATAFGIRGVNYGVTSACASSAHAIGSAFEQIQFGKQDVMFAGGGEESHWSGVAMFNAMGALSTHYNETPARASRPYDADRDGFIMSSGGGMLVLESLDHALARGAHIHAELIGYGATSDGVDMVQPSGEGAVRCMRMALRDVTTPVDYLNTHGTGTPAGDIVELAAVRTVFGEKMPLLSSTKALTGHPIGAAGVHESIYSMLMLREQFVVASHNIDNLDPAAQGYPLVRTTRDAKLRTVMSNSFGFGGANATLVYRRFDNER